MKTETFKNDPRLPEQLAETTPRVCPTCQCDGTIEGRSQSTSIAELEAWKESATTLALRYDAIAEPFASRLGESKVEALAKGIAELQAERDKTTEAILDAELKYTKRVAKLEAENESLKRVCNANIIAGTELVAQVEALQKANDALREALTKIAAFDDEGASRTLKDSGSYSRFDEPGGVQIARAALAHLKE